MITDRGPRKSTLLADFMKSDLNKVLSLPTDNRIEIAAKGIESSLETAAIPPVRHACDNLISILAGFYHVETPTIRVLAARPIRSREGRWAMELFGDYDPRTQLIRVWMKTAVRKQMTSFGTLLSTLCHEL